VEGFTVRRLLAVLLVLAFVAVVAPAAPVPKHLMKNQGPVYYYPTALGAKWVYNEPDGDHVLVVSKVEDRKGTKVVTVEHENGKQRVVDQVMEVSEAGLTRLSCGGEPFDVPLVMLEAPFRIGTTWENKTSGAQGTSTIVGVETIKVPAGTFEAVRVDMEQNRAGRLQGTLQAWYAPGVGLLKMTENDKVIWLLKSFTSGKE
jgi:hypothetical protein